MTKHDEYFQEVDDRIRYFVTDMDEELDNIERLVRGNESAVLLLQWVRDTMQRVAENYER
jgi:hypothetical protein